MLKTLLVINYQSLKNCVKLENNFQKINFYDLF
jgi:hypothetical protein